ncbi:MAG: hypothetical protein ACLFN1_09025, partial [Bacteroidales bacterium]
KGKSNTLFPVRDAWWYVPYVPMQAKGMPTLGSANFLGDNPPFGAVFTYYIDNTPETAKAERKKEEKALREKDASIPFPGWERLQQEADEDEPQVLLLVSDENGDPLRWIKGKAKKGLHRADWDLRLPPPNPVSLSQPAFKPPWAGDAAGPMVAPGKYSVALYIAHNGTLKAYGEPQQFSVKAVPNTSPGADFNAIAEFKEKTSELYRQIMSAGRKLGEAGERIRYMKAALLKTPKASPELFAELDQLEQNLAELQKRLYGDPVRQGLNEATAPSINSRVGKVVSGHWETRQNPTATHKRNIEIAEKDFSAFRDDLDEYFRALEEYEAALDKAGAPYTPGRKLE